MESKNSVAKVLSQIDRTELVELTRALIRILSVYRPEGGGNEEEVAHFVAEKRVLRSDRRLLTI